MKYGEMTEEQKTAYKEKQRANQQLARDRAKSHTVNLTITGLSEDQFNTIVSIVEKK